MYSVPEPLNIDGNISQDIRWHMNKEEPWTPPLIKGTGMTVTECLQVLLFLEANNRLGICEKKNNNDVFTLDWQYCYDIAIEMPFRNVFLMASWWNNLSLEKDFHYKGVC